MKKYIGRIVEIIYEDRKGNITQRRIEVLGVRNGRVKANCLKSRELRIFNEANILAMKPVRGASDAS